MHHRDATIEPLTNIVGIGIDLSLLSAPCNATVQTPMKCEVPRRRAEARKASSLASLGYFDIEPDDISGLDDDEYVPPEEANQRRGYYLRSVIRIQRRNPERSSHSLLPPRRLRT
jgi:hypothetical protein